MARGSRHCRHANGPTSFPLYGDDRSHSWYCASCSGTLSVSIYYTSGSEKQHRTLYMYHRACSIPAEQRDGPKISRLMQQRGNDILCGEDLRPCIAWLQPTLPTLSTLALPRKGAATRPPLWSLCPQPCKSPSSAQLQPEAQAVWLPSTTS